MKCYDIGDLLLAVSLGWIFGVLVTRFFISWGEKA